MRIDKSQYKLFPDHVLYEPVAGLTIRQAVEDSIQISAFENMPVHVNINDITLIVHRNSRISTLVAKYLLMLERRNYQKLVLESKQNKR